MQIIIGKRTLDEHRAELESLDGVEPVWVTKDGTWEADPARAQIGFFSQDLWTPNFDTGVLPRLVELPAVTWLHTFTAGVDHPLFRRAVERGIAVTHSPGISAYGMAQHVITMMLCSVRPVHAWMAAQRERHWQGILSDELTGKTVGVVGLGHVGSEVARLCSAFRMRVLGCRRDRAKHELVDQQFSPEQLGDMLEQCDFVALALPLTSETRGMIGAAELGRMRTNCWLINVSRGALVDEEALVRVLEDRRIRGASLDVFEHEPLPKEHKLWGMPNVVVTPHCSPVSPQMLQRSFDLFLENLRRRMDDCSLLHRVTLA